MRPKKRTQKVRGVSVRGCIDKWDSGFYTATPGAGPRSGAAVQDFFSLAAAASAIALHDMLHTVSLRRQNSRPQTRQACTSWR
jgi:hypothetical protein